MRSDRLQAGSPRPALCRVSHANYTVGFELAVEDFEVIEAHTIIASDLLAIIYDSEIGVLFHA